MENIDYKKVFSKLSHILALSNDRKFDEIIQNIILYSLTQNPEKSIATDYEVSANIKQMYGISIKQNSITSNIDKLINTGELLRDRKTKTLRVNEQKLKAIKERIDKTNELEDKVKKNWQSEIIAINPDLKGQEELLWATVKTYLSIVFEQHGVETIQILKPITNNSEIEQKSLQTIADEALKLHKMPFDKDLFFSLLNHFIKNADELRANYISQLADATFTSFALTNDTETTNFLNYKFKGLILFLDTNFIFGLLNLHKNIEDTSAIEILNEAQKNKISLKLLYHPITLAEFRRSFNLKSLSLKSTNWTKESSRVAIKIEGLSPLEYLFHKQNIENEIDAKIFLEKYNHVDLLLKDFELTEYTTHGHTPNEHVDIETDIEAYTKFYYTNPTRKGKSFQQFQHDITVLREVRALNKKKSKFLDANAFFISSDYILAKFEKEYYKKPYEISFLLSPSVFLQILRPFVENNYMSNKRFIETFSIPDFRSFDIDYSGTKSKALQIINDNFHGASDETKVAILRDQVILEKLSAASEDNEKQIRIIETMVAAQNQFLIEENKKLMKTIEDSSIQQNENKEKALKELLEEKNELEKNLTNFLTLNKKLENDRDNQENKLREMEQSIFKLSEKVKKEENEKKLNAYTFLKMQELRADYSNNSKKCIRPAVVSLITIVSIPIIFKNFNAIYNWFVIKKFPPCIFYIAIALFFFIALFDLIYRTYIADKEEMKKGFKWWFTLGIEKKKIKLLNSHKEELIKAFNQENT